jgi:hypothetical protein
MPYIKSFEDSLPKLSNIAMPNDANKNINNIEAIDEYMLLS